MDISVKKQKVGSGYSIFLLVLAILFIAGGVVYFCVSLNNRSEDYRIISQGLRAKGTIEDKYMGIYDSADEIKYTFDTYDGKLITTRKAVSSSIYRKVQKGSLIEIAYDPANPSKNLPVEQGVRPLWHITLFTAPLIIIGVLLMRAWRKTRQNT